jgi:hypothetical protein
MWRETLAGEGETLSYKKYKEKKGRKKADILIHKFKNNL